MSRPKDADRSQDADTSESVGPKPEGESPAPESPPRPDTEADAGTVKPVDDGTGDVTDAPADDPASTDDWRRDDEAEPVAETAVATGDEPAPAREEAGVDDHDEHDEHGMGTAGRLLVLLVVAIVAALGALYAAPKLAPHVPAGVAAYLLPGQQDAQARIDQLSANLQAAEARIAAVEQALDQRAGSDAVMGVAEQVTELEGRVSAVEKTAGELSDRVAAAETVPAPAAATGGATADEIAALAVRLDKVAASAEAGAGLESEVAAIRRDLDALSARIDAVESARETEVARLEKAVRASALETAIATLTDAARAGAPYGDALSEVEAISGTTAPAAVAAGADGTVPSAVELARSMPEPARAALSADVRANAGEGVLGQIGAWARSQVVMRPTTPRDGDDVGAILSRVGAALEAGNAIEAQAEAAALPDHAKAAMGGWLDRLAARAALDKAMTEWTGGLGARG